MIDDPTDKPEEANETPAEDEAPPTDPGPVTDADSPAPESVAEPPKVEDDNGEA